MNCFWILPGSQQCYSVIINIPKGVYKRHVTRNSTALSATTKHHKRIGRRHFPVIRVGNFAKHLLFLDGQPENTIALAATVSRR